MAKRILILGDYATLEPEFIKEVGELKKLDPFGPLLILVPTKLLQLHLRRLLAERGVPHFNLRFRTLEEFAREIGTPHLLARGRTEIPSYADQLLIAEITRALEAGDRFYFRAIADRPGFHRAILSTLKDLKDACLSPAEIEPLLSKGRLEGQVHLQKLTDLLRIWRAYEQRLEDLQWFNESDLMLQALERANSSPIIGKNAKILLYGFYDFNTVQKRLLLSIFAEREAVVFLPFETAPAFQFVRPTLKWLQENGFREREIRPEIFPVETKPFEHLCRHLFGDAGHSGGTPEKILVLSAPGEPRETREVLRVLFQSLEEGIPFHETGILVRSPRDYSRLFREAFDELGITPYVQNGLPLIETAAGRTLLLILNILRKNFSRQSVMEFALFARLKSDLFPADQGNSSASLWDALSIHAGVVEGEREWWERLERVKKSIGSREKQDEESGETRSTFLSGDRAALDQLIRFIGRLFGALRKLEESNSWTGKVKALLEAFDSLVEQEEESEILRQTIGRLSELDATGIKPGDSDFARIVGEALEDQPISVGRFQRNGPAVIDLMAAHGIPFRMVALPGMVEKSFPPVIRQDAILLDRERRALNLLLSGKAGDPIPLKAENRLKEERLLFRLAVGAAKERLLFSLPRIEAGTGRERLPSSFLLAAVKALTGRGVDFRELESFPGFVRVPLSQAASNTPERALDETEFDLSLAQAEIAAGRPGTMLYLRGLSPFFARGLNAEHSRWEETSFTRFEGILSSEEARASLRREHSFEEKIISPTRLENYASCPYGYFLEQILGIEPFIEPEKVRTISPLDKGTLVHSILWRFYSELKEERGSPFCLNRSDRKKLLQTAAEKFDEFEKMGLTGYAMLWEVEKKRILRDLLAFFEEELRETDFFPAYFEIRYGMRAMDSQESEISTHEPIPVVLGGRVFRLKGRIDRIDLSRDEQWGRVIDYKTGKVSGSENDFQGGRALQLPLYLHVARHLLGGRHRNLQIRSAGYYFLKEGKRIGFDSAELEKRGSELRSVMETIASGIEDGLFFAVPDLQCRYCEFKMVCGGSGRLLFKRKAKDPRIEGYLKMRQGESLLGDEDAEEDRE